MRSGPAIGVLLLAALSLGGCFVVDELDRASESAERFSRSEKPETPQPDPVAGRRREPSVLDRVADRAADLRDWIEEALEHRGPEDDIVRCRLRDGLRYTSRGDCHSLGGKVGRG